MVSGLNPDSLLPDNQIEARSLLQSIEAALFAAGINSAKSDARCLLGLALGRDEAVLPHEDIPPLDQAGQMLLDGFIQRRASGEPVSRIRGWREFWSLRFTVSPAVLDPRPDSETLVDAAVKWTRVSASRNQPLRCLDLGTGSGCLLLAVLHELNEFPGGVTGVGIDISAEAIDIARQNLANLVANNPSASDLSAEFHQHSFADDLGGFGAFDMVLSNPPYIPSGDIAHLADDVKGFDPMGALDGGGDGMACWTLLLPRLAAVLTPNGTGFVEIGQGQSEAVCAVAARSSLRLIAQYNDLAGITRVLQFGNKI